MMLYVSVCEDVDECDEYDADKGLCDVDADCINNFGSYQCLCRDGYTGDGVRCRGSLPSSPLHINHFTIHS